jgi:hypothetical protein
MLVTIIGNLEMFNKTNCKPLIELIMTWYWMATARERMGGKENGWW